MSYYADRIKEVVSTEDACRAYGIRVNASGFASCPFHHEKAASMKVYPGSRGWNCFGCGRHGDVIDLVAELYGLTFKEAVSKLNDDFSVGLPLDRKIGAYRREKIRAQVFARQREKQFRDQQIDRLEADYDEALDQYCLYERLARRYAPTQPEDRLLPVFLYASHHLPDAGYNLDRAADALYRFKRDHNV